MGLEKKVIRKHERVLELYSRLMAGETVKKKDLAEEYGVDPRSIQRDIDSIRDFCSDRAAKGGGLTEIQYDHKEKGFRIVSKKTVTLTDAELFSVAKILLESRSLNKKEMEEIITALLDSCLSTSEKRKMSDLIRNEMFHYVEPRHGKALVNTIWELGTAVHGHRKLQIEYEKVNGEVTEAVLKPVGIVGSEYYFYLIAYIGDNDKKYSGYPTIYRIDRIRKFSVLPETFRVPYADRFEEGEFRKRIPFMYGGPLKKVRFIYKGTDINAVLDRLPSAECVKLADGRYQVCAEVYGTIGLDLWINGQTWIEWDKEL